MQKSNIRFSQAQTRSERCSRPDAFYIEQGCQFTIMFGDMWEQFYITMETNFEKALNFIFLNGLLLNYYERIENLIYSVNNCGWGFADSLMDIYHKYR